MKKGDKKSQEGFTIIETSLVIAVAGLIFLMVFIALPGLRASQRDTDRRAAITKVIKEIKDYQSNNRGSLPSDWNDFYNQYLGGSNFIDPNGKSYNLSVVQCGDGKVDENCVNPSLDLSSTGFPNGYTIYVVPQASCSGEVAIKASNPRKVAVLYRLERAGVYCENT